MMSESGHISRLVRNIDPLKLLLDCCELLLIVGGFVTVFCAASGNRPLITVDRESPLVQLSTSLRRCFVLKIHSRHRAECEPRQRQLCGF